MGPAFPLPLVTPCPVTCPGLGSGFLGARGEDTGVRVFAREHSQPSSPLWLMSWGPTAQRCLRHPLVYIGGCKLACELATCLVFFFLNNSFIDMFAYCTIHLFKV